MDKQPKKEQLIVNNDEELAYQYQETQIKQKVKYNTKKRRK